MIKNDYDDDDKDGKGPGGGLSYETDEDAHRKFRI